MTVPAGPLALTGCTRPGFLHRLDRQRHLTIADRAVGGDHRGQGLPVIAAVPTRASPVGVTMLAPPLRTLRDDRQNHGVAGLRRWRPPAAGSRSGSRSGPGSPVEEERTCGGETGPRTFRRAAPGPRSGRRTRAPRRAERAGRAAPCKSSTPRPVRPHRSPEERQGYCWAASGVEAIRSSRASCDRMEVLRVGG